jgi:small subunit ribosomal protein S20
MPITKSAIRALRKSRGRYIKNLKRKTSLKDAIKKVESAAAAKNAEEARKLLPLAYKTIDKMAKAGLIKKNTASRKKSRLAKLVGKVQ